jgi:hypothetical protein
LRIGCDHIPPRNGEGGVRGLFAEFCYRKGV